ncbi:transcription termination factor 1-like isoform X2 [Sardina pilchardus]
MTEAELLPQEKKKKKKNKKHRPELAPEPGSPQETATEVDSVKTYKHKKKKSKGPEEDDFTPAEVPCGIGERKKKRKREAENLNVTRVMTEESADVAVPQEGEIKKKKKKKKRRADETVSTGENTEADVSLTPVQVDSEASQQKPAKKSQSEKIRKNANSQPAENTLSPAENTLSPAENTLSPADDTLSPAEDTLSPAEDRFVALPQEEELKRREKKKKRRADETVSTGESTEADVSPTPVQVDSEASQQKPAKKRKSEKIRKIANSQPAENTLSPAEDGLSPAEDTLSPAENTLSPAEDTLSPAENTLSPAEDRPSPAEDTLSLTDTTPHLDDGLKEAPVLDLDDAVLQELKEFLPNFQLHDHAWVVKVINYDLPRFREFKTQGIPVRTGRFTASENKKLQLNVKNFLLISGIDSAEKLFKPHRFPDEMSTIRSQKRQLGFIRSVCAGIPRSWFTILARARKMFDEENYKGKFTEDENEALKKLHTLHGTNWLTISDKMGRSQEAVKKRFAMMSEAHGSWSEAEMKTLLTSVRQLLLERAEPDADGSLIIKKSDLYKKLAWVCVAEQQQARSWLQCREKWMEYLTRRMTTGGTIKGRKSLNGQIQLIKALNEMAVEDPADIVWDDLTHLFGNTPPDYLQMRYYQLKLTYVPGWNTKPFCDVVDFLYGKVLPQLEAQLETCEEEDMPCEERQTYKLSEIFPDS